jgi:hypothetical protein
MIERPWYKKKRFLLPIAGLFVLVIFAAAEDTTPPNEPAGFFVQPAHTTGSSQGWSNVNTEQPATPQTNLSNSNYYTNVNGERVKSPAYSLDGSVPAGATARCRNGTYSFSQNRRGTCSHHGGVAQWLR